MYHYRFFGSPRMRNRCVLGPQSYSFNKGNCSINWNGLAVIRTMNKQSKNNNLTDPKVIEKLTSPKMCVKRQHKPQAKFYDRQSAATISEPQHQKKNKRLEKLLSYSWLFKSCSFNNFTGIKQTFEMLEIKNLCGHVKLGLSSFEIFSWNGEERG